MRNRTTFITTTWSFIVHWGPSKATGFHMVWGPVSKCMSAYNMFTLGLHARRFQSGIAATCRANTPRQLCCTPSHTMNLTLHVWVLHLGCSVRLTCSRMLEGWQQRRNCDMRASRCAKNLLASWIIMAWYLIEMTSVAFRIHYADTQHWVTNSKDRPVHLVLHNIWKEDAQVETFQWSTPCFTLQSTPGIVIFPTLLIFSIVHRSAITIAV